MASIFLTGKCNLKCPYCFADEFVNSSDNQITVENFKLALEFIKTGSGYVGIIGGEPLIHSRFDEILDILSLDKKIKEVCLFTNGINIDRYYNKIKNEKFLISINCNEPSVLDLKYQLLENNIKQIKKIKHKDVNLKINLYNPKMDYSYIFDLLDILGQKTLGFSIAISNNEKRTTENVFEHFQSFIPLLKRFFKDCLEKEVIPYGDCNSIPYCMLDEEYKILLIKLAQKAKKMDIKTNPHNSSVTCRPHVNILPDLTAVRCFSLSSYKKVSINDFKTLNSLENYFYNSIDIYSNLSYLRKECVECKHRLIGRCGVCFAYKLNQIERIRETVNQVNTSFYE